MSLNISENDNSLDLNLALDVAEYFRLKGSRANEIIETVKKTVNNWQVLVKKIGLSKEEQELMSSAFIK